MRSVPLSTESNHLKVTSTPEPLSLTISIFIFTVSRECPRAQQPIADRSIKESRRLIVPWMNLLVSMLYFCPSYDPSAGGGGHVKFTQEKFRSRPRHVLSHDDADGVIFRNLMKLLYVFINRSKNSFEIL